MILCEYHSRCWYVSDNCYDENIKKCFFYQGLKKEDDKNKLDKGLVSKLKKEK